MAGVGTAEFPHPVADHFTGRLGLMAGRGLSPAL